jgi:hypothetical protein
MKAQITAFAALLDIQVRAAGRFPPWTVLLVDMRQRLAYFFGLLSCGMIRAHY